MSRELVVGARAPAFEARDQHGALVRSGDYRGRWIVVYFYPMDETFGCIREACEFRDRLPELAAVDVDVLGVSRDSVDSHRAFASNRRLPFKLLADVDGAIARAFGAERAGGLARRVSFLLDPEGIVRAVYGSEIRFTNHVEEMLAARLAADGPFGQ